MTKPGDLQTKKTIHQLSKEFPNKTYAELEKYRDADRQEEAQRITTQHENEELKKEVTVACTMCESRGEIDDPNDTIIIDGDGAHRLQ